MGFPQGWSRRATLTIAHGQVSTAAQANFPVLFWWSGSSASSNLPSEMFDSTSPFSCTSTGSDIRFTSDPYGVTQLPCQVASFSGLTSGGSTSTGQIWVKVPSVSNTVDTVIYIWYHNPFITMPLATDTYGSQNVWTNGFSAVYHLEAANFTDSTATGANGANAGSSDATGAFGGGKSFNGTSNGILLTNFHTSTTAMTLSGWAKPSSTTQAAYAKIVSKTTLTNAAPYCEMNLAAAQGTGTSNVVTAECAISGTDRGVNGTSVLSTTAFQYLSGTYDGTTLTAYYNGASQGTPGAYSGTITQTTDPINIGRAYFNNSPAQWFAGIIDEVRIASAVRTAGWLLTEYNNGSSPQTFATVTTKDNMYPMMANYNE